MLVQAAQKIGAGLSIFLLILLAFNSGYGDLAQVLIFFIFLVGGVVRLAQWIVSLFLEGMRRMIRRVELIVNTTLTLLLLSGLIAREVLIRTLLFILFACVGVRIILIILHALWFKFKEIRERNKDPHTTLCIAMWIFTIYFFFEVVPPYDNPNACFTSRFYTKADIWMIWAFGRVIRWFLLSGF